MKLNIIVRCILCGQELNASHVNANSQYDTESLTVYVNSHQCINNDHDKKNGEE